MWATSSIKQQWCLIILWNYLLSCNTQTVHGCTEEEVWWTGEIIVSTENGEEVLKKGQRANWNKMYSSFKKKKEKGAHPAGHRVPLATDSAKITEGSIQEIREVESGQDAVCDTEKQVWEKKSLICFQTFCPLVLKLRQVNSACFAKWSCYCSSVLSGCFHLFGSLRFGLQLKS